MAKKHSTTRVCSVKGCQRKHSSKGFCDKHYRQMRKHGTTNLMPHEICFSFLVEAIKLATDSCIPWPFGISKNGYGAMIFEGKQTTSHRVALVLSTGKNPSDLQACHSCRLRCCVNPRHLRWGTPRENQLDRIKDGTHQIGRHNSNAVLTESQVLSIYSDPRQGVTLADEYSVSSTAIYYIKQGKAWSSVTGHKL